MANHKRSHNNRRPKTKRRSNAPPTLAPVEIPQSKPQVEYGEPFTLLEDEDKSTFEFKAGAWVPYEMTIAQCRLNNCKVNELPQKVKFKTRYEVRLPLDE
jgi:hypothetical protein